MKKLVCRIIAWLLIFSVLFLFLQAVFMPKWQDGLAATTDIDGFYAEDKDTLDVVFFGTSHVICGISPMELYRNYGIKSYVLATGDQPMQSTYYWIREAHKSQRSMVAVVDVWSLLFTDQVTEEVARESVDDMQFSPNKLSAVKTLCETYGLPMFDFIFPLFRYHQRWTELTGEDVRYLFQDKHDLWRGHYPIAGYEYSEYQGVDLLDSTVTEEEPPELKPENVEELKRIVSYCEAEGIPLLLTKVPLMTWTAERHNAVSEIADSCGATFFDMNLNPYYQTIGMDPEVDYQGKDHLNMTGAVKVSRAFGEYLLENGYLSEEAIGSPDSATDRWEADLPRYQHSYKSTYLPLVTDIHSFAEQIAGDPDYVVFYGYQDNGTPDFSPEYAEALSVLGIDPEKIMGRVTKLTKIVYNGEELLFRETDGEKLILSGTVDVGDIPYEICLKADDKAMVIDGKERSVPLANGLHVVVYSLEEADVICSVCFTPVGNGDIYWQVRPS